MGLSLDYQRTDLGVSGLPCTLLRLNTARLLKETQSASPCQCSRGGRFADSGLAAAPTLLLESVGAMPPWCKGVLPTWFRLLGCRGGAWRGCRQVRRCRGGGRCTLSWAQSGASSCGTLVNCIHLHSKHNKLSTHTRHHVRGCVDSQPPPGVMLPPWYRLEYSTQQPARPSTWHVWWRCAPRPMTTHPSPTPPQAAAATPAAAAPSSPASALPAALEAQVARLRAAPDARERLRCGRWVCWWWRWQQHQRQ